MPRTLRNVSCCPANEASGRSSAVADGPHRERQRRASSPASCSYAVADVGLQVRPGTAASTTPSRICFPTSASSADVVGVQPVQLAADQVGQPGVADEAAVGVGGGGEPVRHPHPGRGQVGHHLPQRGVLAADLLQVGQSELGEPDDVAGSSSGLLLLRCA